MKYYKKFIALILAITIVFMNVSYAYANSENDSMSNHIKEMFLENLAEAEEIYHRVVNTIQNANNLGDDLDYLFRALAMSVGIIVSGSYFVTVNTLDSGIGQIIDGWEELTDAQKRNKLGETLTDDIQITDDEIILGPDANLILKYYINQVMSSNKYYTAYTLDLQRYTYSGWWTTELKDLIEQYQNDYWIIAGANGGAQSTWYYFFIKKDKVGAIYSDVVGNYMYKANFIDSYTFTDKLINENESFYYTKAYNGTLSVKMPYSPPYRLNFQPATGTNNNMFTKFVNQNKQFISSEISIAPSSSNNFTVSYGKRYQVTLYSSVALFSSVSRNESPYYVSNKYSDFANSSGTYTIDSNNSNVIKYGDIVTYNNNYYNNNGQYPTMPQIDIYINDNNPDATPPNNGGGGGGQGGQGGQGGTGGAGGSANVTNNNNPTFNNNPNININLGFPSISDNTVSGNGAGSAGGVGNIFGFLSQIGKVIGDLIKNIGEVLADILEGIVSVVSSLVESIPTVFGEFMGALIGWLPAELQALITLSITAMIIVGLIKLFRG